MAFPVVESTATTGRTAAETTSPVTFPATISPSALIVCIARSAVAGAIGWPVNWVELVEDSSDGSDDVSAIAYFTAVGNEDGTTFNVTHGSGKSAYVVYSITGAEVPATQAPQISTVATGTTASPDPTSLTPTGGAKDYLWLWLGGWEGEQTSPPASTPTNYTDALGASTGVGGAIATNARTASARRALNAASEDPPLWTISASDDWATWTMAVHPAGGGPVTLAAAPAGVATVTGAIAVAVRLATTSAGVATVTTSMAVAVRLAAAPAGVATVTAALTVTSPIVELAALSAGVATVTASLAVAVRLAAAPAGVATVTAAAAIAVRLATQSAGVATTTAALALRLVLAGAPTGVATVNAAMALRLALRVAPAGVATVTAALDTRIGFGLLSDVVLAQSQRGSGTISQTQRGSVVLVTAQQGEVTIAYV